MEEEAEDREIVVIDDSDDSIVILESGEGGSTFQEDWDNIKRPANSDSQIVITDFFLIMELNRLVPYVENSKVKFHPMNMPFIKLGKIEVAGFVIDVKKSPGYIEVLVEDGTGALTICYEQKQYSKDKENRNQILERYRQYAKNIDKMTFGDKESCPKKLPEIRPDLVYSSETSIQKIAMLEHKWWLETEKGLLGKAIVPTDYVKATGYCHLDFQSPTKSQKNLEEITFDHLCNAKLTFLATKLQCIEEIDYNQLIKKWINISAKRRYRTNREVSEPQ